MEQCHSPPVTSPPPRTAIDCGSAFDSFDEASPCKRQKILLIDRKFDESLSPTVRLILKNGEITMERSLLAHFSNYFRSLFSSNFRDSNQNVHRIRLVTIGDFHFLLTIPRAFENGIRPELTLQRAIDLLEPAAYLQIDAALDHITEVISQNLHHENIIRLLRLSLLYHTPLAYKIWHFMIAEFQILFNTNEYLKLSEIEIMTLLSEKRLNLRSENEKKVCETWLHHHQFEKPHKFEKFVQANFARRSMPDSTFYEVIRTRQPRCALIAHGGWASRRPGKVVEVFNFRCDMWQISDLTIQEPVLNRSYHGIEIVNDKMIIFGGLSGTSGYQTTILFDLNTKKWKFGRNMHDRRCYISSAKLENSNDSTLIFACGGMNGISRLSSAEVYNVNEDRWKTISSMHHQRSDGWTVSIGDKIVCVGGFDGRQGHNTGEMYDPVRDGWTMLSRPMKTRRTGMSAVSVMNNAIIACGGFNGSRRLDSSELYDVREGIWHHLPNMHSGRSNFGISFVDNTTVYVAGGYNGSTTTKENERLDLRMRTWKALPDLRESKSALRLFNLSDHPILDEVFNVHDDDGIVTTW